MLTFPSTLNCKNASRAFLNGELENGCVCIDDESGSGTKATCRSGRPMSAPEATADLKNTTGAFDGQTGFTISSASRTRRVDRRARKIPVASRTSSYLAAARI